MQTDNKLLDDLARVATGALGTLQGARDEVESVFRRRLERLLVEMDLVTRDEFDAVQAMAVAAREENERLSARIAELEAKLAPAAKKPARKAKPKAKAKPKTT